MTDASGVSVGVRVALGLAVLTVLEYVAAAADIPGLLLWLAGFALGKAWLIVTYFMHIRQLKTGGGV